ncbi:MAG: hypothetical protein JHC79_20190 [Williamsia sp.]|nr:hypothetical protein [Williamsia sp.]
MSTYGLVAVSVVALAVVIVGLTLPGPEPELTTAPPPSTEAPSSAAAPTENKVVDEPFDPKAPIPGCDTVEVPDEPTYSSRVTTGRPGYDNPKFPWFNGPKATAMSTALAQDLPAGAEIDFASPSASLVFQPISDFGDDDPTGTTNAYGSVSNGDARGGVQIAVQKSSRPIPPCVAGQLDERRSLPDGVVVDLQDTWREINGTRTNTRSASAYVPDGSWIYASSNDSVGNTGGQNSGRIPLTIDDLVRIAGDPRLRVTAAVTAGTPAPSQGCSGPSAFDSANGPAVTREQAKRLDRVLATIDFGGPSPGPLQLTDFSDDALCVSVPDAMGGATIDIAIAGGRTPPAEERPDPVSGAQKTRRVLQDGTVVQTLFANYAPALGPDGGDSRPQSANSVVVTRPGGTEITIRSSAVSPNSATPLERLESIALTPGLEL